MNVRLCERSLPAKEEKDGDDQRRPARGPDRIPDCEAGVRGGCGDGMAPSARVGSPRRACMAAPISRVSTQCVPLGCCMVPVPTSLERSFPPLASGVMMYRHMDQPFRWGTAVALDPASRSSKGWMAPLYGERLPIEKRRVSSMLSTKRRWRIPMSGFGRCRPDGFPSADREVDGHAS